MTFGPDNILSPVQRGQLVAAQKTAQLLGVYQNRLATGFRVNSAIDNPQNYFAARALRNHGNDLARLLDGVGQSLQLIKAADAGLEAITHILNQAESLVATARETFPAEGILEAGQVQAGSLTTLSELITASNPAAYWRLDETSGAAAVNTGSGGAAINGTYTGGVGLGDDPLYTEGSDGSASFNGSTQFVAIPNSALINTVAHARRTVELVFNADTTAGRQVLYEEGGTTNAFAIYIDNGRLYVTGRDAGAWGPPNFSVPIDAGETYHVAFVFDRPGGEFRGYVNGALIGSTPVAANFPSHTAAVSIGRMSGGAWFHDGSVNNNGFYFDGRISDVALYNAALTDTDMEARYTAIQSEEIEGLNDEYEALMTQIDMVVADSFYRGQNLLNGDVARVVFNAERTSYLSVGDGDMVMTAAGLGVDDRPFITPSDLDETLEKLRVARDNVRAWAGRLAGDLAVIVTREQFMRGDINVAAEGADNLTISDQNEDGAMLLALQTRQQMQVSMMAFGTPSILDVLA